MAKTVEQIRDGLEAGDKALASDLHCIAQMKRMDLPLNADSRWTCLPVNFRSRYEGIDAEGSLIPKADLVMAQVLSVLHPADREHATALVRFITGSQTEAFPDGVGLRYAVDAETRKLVCANETWPVWTAFLAEHSTAPDAEVAALRARVERLNPATNHENVMAQLRTQRAVLAAAGINTTPQETTTMTTNEKKTGPNLATMATNAAWQAGVIVATNEVRNFLVTLLTMDLPEDRRESGRALAAEMLSGRFGTPLVSAALGASLFGAEQAGFALPMLSPAVQTRLCEETSTLAMREGMVIAYTAGRDLIATHGKGLLEALGNLNAIAARTHVRIDDGEAREPAEVPAVNGHARTAQA